MVYYKLMFLTIICYLHHCNCFEISDPNRQQSKAQIFLLRLLQQKDLNVCKLMFLERRDQEKSLETLSYITSSSNFSYYNVVLNFNHFNTSRIQNQPVAFHPSITDHNKYSGQCVVVIISVKDRRPKFMTEVFRLITPIHLPKTRKNEDYFIFLTKPEDSKTILMMNELPGRTKFKLSVSEEETGKVTIRSVCFFCNEGLPTFVGFPEIVDPDFVYFPDFVTHLNGKTLRISVPAMTARIEIDPTNHGLQNAKRGL